MRHWQSGTMIRRFFVRTLAGRRQGRRAQGRLRVGKVRRAGHRRQCAGRHRQGGHADHQPDLYTFYIQGVYKYTEDSYSSMFGGSDDDSIQTDLHPAGRCQGHRRSGGRVPEHHRCGQRRHGQCHGLRQHGGGFLSPATTPATTPGRSAHRAWRACSTPMSSMMNTVSLGISAIGAVAARRRHRRYEYHDGLRDGAHPRSAPARRWARLRRPSVCSLSPRASSSPDRRLHRYCAGPGAGHGAQQCGGLCRQAQHRCDSDRRRLQYGHRCVLSAIIPPTRPPSSTRIEAVRYE